MRRTSLKLTSFLIALCFTLALSSNFAFAAFPACDENDIFAQESPSNCPNTAGAACLIKKDYDVGTNCTFNFSGRAVTIGSGSRIDVASGSMLWNVGSIVLDSNSEMRGKGATGGGNIRIHSEGNITLNTGATKAKIDVSNSVSVGDIDLTAAGDIVINGFLLGTHSSTATSGGGSVFLDAGGDVIMGTTSKITFTGGQQSFGGDLDVSAGGSASLAGPIDLSGGSGGFLDVFVDGDFELDDDMDTHATGDAEDGGDVDIFAGENIFLRAKIITNGSNGTFQSGGSAGGLDLTTEFGNIVISDVLRLNAGEPDGDGGDVFFVSSGFVTVSSSALISSNGGGGGISTGGLGGDIDIEAATDINVVGNMTSIGGFGGGFVTLSAGRNVDIFGDIDARTGVPGEFGGDVTIDAGRIIQQNGSVFATTLGKVFIDGTVDVTGGGCSTYNGCGAAGAIDVTACGLEFTSSGKFLASSPSGGDVTISLSGQLTMPQGSVINASRTVGTELEGSVTIDHPILASPTLLGNISPVPFDVNPLNRPLCAVCGNNIVEAAETCDDGNENSCDGCSRLCRLEDCDDSNFCTSDSCDASLGCRNQPRQNGITCNDGQFCTLNDACLFGTCTGASRDCSGVGDQCNLGVCNDDVDACVPQPRGNGASCNDSNACTSSDQCLAGTCTGTPTVCQPLDACHDAGVCNPLTGICSNPPKADGSPCNDSNLCTQTDSCIAGNCSGGNPVICNALDQCHDPGVCNPGTGFCSNPNKPDGTACDDGLFCTVLDACVTGVCGSATSRDCSDGSGCTQDACNETLGICENDPIAGACCGDGSLNPGEECDEGGANSDAPNATCRSDCSLPICGDGIVDDLSGEVCDEGGANSDAPNASCRIDCSAARCGDGILDDLAGEVCDDGNVSNGDGCSSSCQEELEPPDLDFVRGGGSKKIDCNLQWGLENPSLDRKGFPGKKQICQDGDPSCDHDAIAGQCTFEVWICANRTDPALMDCDPGIHAPPSALRVLKPNVKDAERSVDRANLRADLADALALLEGQSANELCSGPVSVRVPLKAPGKKGKESLKVAGLTAIGKKESDGLKLFCLP